MLTQKMIIKAAMYTYYFTLTGADWFIPVIVVMTAVLPILILILILIAVVATVMVKWYGLIF